MNSIGYAGPVKFGGIQKQTKTPGTEEAGEGFEKKNDQILEMVRFGPNSHLY